jgi:hypothetical protein
MGDENEHRKLITVETEVQMQETNSAMQLTYGNHKIVYKKEL